MKSVINFIAMAIAGLVTIVSCQNKLGSEDIPSSKFEVSVGISNVDVSVVESKANITATDSEKKVDDAYIIVYNKNTGAMVDYKAWSGSSVKFALEAGTYQFYAAVNCGMSSAPSSISALKEMTGKLKDDLSGFTMLGMSEKTISSGNETFSITVSRLASKIIFDKFAVNFSAAALQSQNVTVDAVYMINVAGDCSYSYALTGSSYSPTLWYNQLKYVSGDCNSYLYAGNLNKSVSHGSETTIGKTFYCYPNGTAGDAHGGNFTARKTRLVIEATVGGSKCYYPFTFDSIESNKVYTVKSITVTRKGVNNPDDIWNSDEVSGSVIVGDWTNGGEFSEQM